MFLNFREKEKQPAQARRNGLEWEKRPQQSASAERSKADAKATERENAVKELAFHISPARPRQIYFAIMKYFGIS